ncbi:hypothetical protein H072_3425 [Dactylellina haptotyla CBS 200.50]|uniref:DUF1770 domain-containing protein n=1 Tax=Dactylellina haptotyla (strain CBS 200.50) TaxID=1284197 RepID=S8AND3_DACHA|nr:hypothetical protein H072_3425 [Dactylellina haptotyla CBS 200.50]
MSDIPFLAAETALTDGHIRRDATVESAIAPSTSADSKTIISESSSLHESEYSQVEHEEDDDEEEGEEVDEEDDQDDVASISSSILYPSHHNERSLHHRPLPPLPDLRFEQSYLASIKQAREEKKYWLIALITVRDQLLFPLIQGCVWNLALSGWRFWNRGVKFRGEGVGAKVRRWWWQVNGWEYPTRFKK